MNAASPAGYHDPSIHFVNKVYLNPGELHLAKRPTRVTTVLGSCVAVTLFAPEQHIGGICHGMLPNCPARPHPQEAKLGVGCRDGCFRYMDCAILYMLRAFDKQKVARSSLQVKLFGGADMFSGPVSSTPTVGRKNLEVALDIVRQEGLRVMASNMGGGAGRKLHFYTHTGEVLLKHLNNAIRSLPTS